MKKSLGGHTFLPTIPVLLVGTYDQDGKPNLMTAAWGGICCSSPIPSRRRVNDIAPPVAIIVLLGMQSQRCAAPRRRPPPGGVPPARARPAWAPAVWPGGPPPMITNRVATGGRLPTGQPAWS